MSSFKYIIAIALGCALVSSPAWVQGSEGDYSANIMSIPGAQTGAAALASASDATRRYFAQDGPIQPAITAIGGVGPRIAEQVNKGISQVSEGSRNMAQSLSRSAGQNGQIRMPGAEQLSANMPGLMSRLGQQAQDLIQRKNQIIMGQAQEGVNSANRLGEMMKTPSVESSAPEYNDDGDDDSQLVVKADGSVTDGVSQLQNQAQQQMGSLRNILQSGGQDLLTHLQGLTSIIGQGAQSTLGSLRQTGEQALSEMQRFHGGNLDRLRGKLSSMDLQNMSLLGQLQQGASRLQQSLPNMGNLQSQLQKNMPNLPNMKNIESQLQNNLPSIPRNLNEASQQAQDAASRLSSGLQSAAQGAADRAREGAASLQQGISNTVNGGTNVSN